jgi:lipopolysaccharide transport system permease protein
VNTTVAFDPGAGRNAGWQVFEAATGRCIEEGPWGPGGELTVTLPETDGDYRVFVSSIDVEHGWGYDRGERFLLLEVKISGGKAAIERRETSMRWLQWQMLPGQAWRLLLEPWQVIFRNRSLIAAMVQRDVKGRYRGSFGNMLWTVLNPLLLMVTYFFVFGIVLQTRFPGDEGQAGFVLYFLCGMLPWLAFSEAIGRAPSVVLEHRNFVKKLVFPVEILPVNIALAGLFSSGLALIVYLFFLMAVRERIPPEALWLPVYFVPQVLLTMGVAWLFSAVGVYLRDLIQVNGFLLTLLFFLTPICYPQASLPEWAWPVLQRNPIYKIVYGYRMLFLENSGPAWQEVARIWAYALLLFYVGYAVFRKLRKGFVDVM